MVSTKHLRWDPYYPISSLPLLILYMAHINSSDKFPLRVKDWSHRTLITVIIDIDPYTLFHMKMHPFELLESELVQLRL